MVPRCNIISNPQDELELKEAKDQYSQELERKKTLEGKANNITTISGTVATLLFGLGQFLIGKLIDLHYDFVSYIVFILLLGASLSVIAILLSSLGFAIRDYYYVIAGQGIKEPSILAQQTNEFPSKVADWTKEYIQSTRKNGEANNRKVVVIQWSQTFFFASMITIPVLLVVLIIHSPAASPVFVWATIEVINLGTLTAHGQATGLANVPTLVFLTSDSVSESYDCLHGKSDLQIKTKPLDEKSQGPQQDLSPSNGQISFGVYIPGPPPPIPPTSCPVKLSSITYYNIILHVQQNGTDVLIQRVSEVSRTG